MASLPTGTVTFLFTDIDGSTQLAQEHPDSLLALLERHHAILKSAIDAHGGYTFQIIGDAFCAAFQTAQQALSAAIDAQRLLGAETWSPAPIRVRMGISTGSAQITLQDGRPPDYSSYMNMARVQRIMSLAQGGQILISTASAELLRADLRTNIGFRDMGKQRLKGFPNPERLWQVIAPGLQAEFRPLISVNASPNNLPLQLTSFVGRQHEIADVHRLIQQHRLVTLTGSGGTGKTRLALEAAPDLLDQFPDGIWLVELAPIRDGALVPPTILHLLGLPLESVRQPLEILTDYLAGRSLLILMDNCEHLLAECSVFVEAVLQSAPAVKVLATSREALNVVGEQTYRVPSLPSPDVNHLPSLEQLTQFEAVHLFIERAMLVAPGFTVTNQNAPALAQICHHLDGIPLAIELAAARVKSISLDAIVTRLDDRFRLLTGGSRNALPRQQTLRAMIDWSYTLLSEAEKTVLQRLSVFRGGTTLEAAEEVCSGEGITKSEILDLVSKLVDKSLLSLDESARYQMLETVRQYAAEKLIESGDAEWARDQHLKFMLELAERAEPEIRGPNQLLWLDRLEVEIDNLRVAVQWAEARDPELFSRLANALWRFCDFRGNIVEGLHWLTHALDFGDLIATSTRARALARASYLSSNLHMPEQAERLAREGAQLAGDLDDKLSMAMCLLMIHDSGEGRQDLTTLPFLEKALDLAREIGEHGLAGAIRLSMGLNSLLQNETDSARISMEAALQEARLSGDRRTITYVLRRMVDLALFKGEIAQADSMMWEARHLAMEMGDTRGVIAAELQLSYNALYREDFAAADAHFDQADKLAQSRGQRDYMAWVLVGRGFTAFARGDQSRAAEPLESALPVARQGSDPYLLVQVLYLLGEAARGQRDHSGAQARYAEAIQVSARVKSRWVYQYCLQGFGAIALERHQAERAARLFAASAKLRQVRYLDDSLPFFVRQREAQIAEARGQLGEEAFNTAWAGGQAMSEEEMLAYALEDKTDDGMPGSPSKSG